MVSGCLFLIEVRNPLCLSRDGFLFWLRGRSATLFLPAHKPIFQEDSEMGAAQNTRFVNNHLGKDFLSDMRHLRPVRLRIPVVFLMKAVVKKQPVVKAVVRAYGVGIIISRSSAIMEEIRVGVNENPAQIIRGQIEVKKVSPIRQKQAKPECAKHQ